MKTLRKLLRSQLFLTILQALVDKYETRLLWTLSNYPHKKKSCGNYNLMNGGDNISLKNQDR